MKKFSLCVVYLALVFCFTGNAQDVKKIAMLVTSATGNTGGVGTQGYTQSCSNRFMQAFEGYVVTFLEAGSTTPSKAELLQQYGQYDLIVVHPTVPGANAHLMGLVTLVGEMPILNLKSFCYTAGSSPRWGWATPNNASGTDINYVTVVTSLQNHPVFKDLSFGGVTGDALYLYTGTALPAVNGISKVSSLPFTGDAWNKDWNDNNHLLATHVDSRTETTHMHEIMLDEAAKYILIAISTENGAFALLNDDALLLFRNAVDYLTDPTVYYDYANNVTVGEGDLPTDDATLRRLTVSVGTLIPAFHSNTTNYSITIESVVKNITITAMPNSRNATVEGAGEQPLITGENVFPIVVTAPDGETQMTYTISVTVIEPPSISNIEILGPDEVEVFASITLTPVITPEFVADKTIVWTLLTPAVASLYVDANDRAIITGLSEGQTVVRVASVANPEIYKEKTITVNPASQVQRQMERLDRGLVAVRGAGTGAAANNVFFSWRLYATDPLGVKFNLYRDDETEPINPEPLDAARTNYTLANGSMTASYSVATIVNGVEVERSAKVSVWTTRDASNNPYLSIPVEKPPTGRVWNGTAFVNYSSNNYDIGHATVADLDGDGQYEIIFFWLPQNLQDNANEGYTGNVYIDAYKLDGTKMWGQGKFINLGNNIRAGAHYNTFLVYDFDGDGKAEIIIKTADGTTDTEGNAVGNPAFDDGRYIQSTGSRWGRILEGAEYISVFEGATGKLLDTQPYVVARGNLNNWGGDTYGNRVDRFLAAVAFLDGVRPSAVMCRGYYTRTTLTAWDWDGKSLQQRWVFDTRPSGGSTNSRYEGQGNHNLSVLPVGAGGKDVIIYGAATINYDGTGLYSTGFNHGDAMHAGKLDPSRPGMQVMRVCESPNPWGMEWHDAATGELIYGVMANPTNADVGRGNAADIDPLSPGAESWGSSAIDGTYSAQGERIGNRISRNNMVIWWDGDTGRELMDGGNGNNPSITKINPTGTLPNRNYSNSTTLATFNNARSNGGTKQNPCLQADILGDWREEALYRSADNSELRIYTTTIPTVHTGAGAVPLNGIPTLMHDHVYRMAIAWQNTAYNQPPHTGFFLGFNMENVPRMGGATFTVTFDPNGGMFEDNTTDVKQISTISGAYFTLPKVNRLGKMFTGWYFPDGKIFDPTVIYKEDIFLKAEWSGNSLQQIDDIQLQEITEDSLIYDVYTTFSGGMDEYTVEYEEGENHTVKVNILYSQINQVDCYCTIKTSISIKKNTYQKAIISAKVRWRISGSEENPEYSDYWVIDSKEISLPEISSYTISFNANIEGGTVSPETKNVTYGEVVGELPVPSRTGYSFDGWNTESNGSGEVYTAETVYRVDGNLTLYAQWTQLPITGGEIDLEWNDLKIYPNPATNIVTISGLEGGELISFFDTGGRICLHIKASNDKEDIAINHLPKGVYIVKITKGNVEKTIKLLIHFEVF